MKSAARAKRRDRRDRRRALALLASCPDGCPEGLMVTHGFTVEQMVELVRDGLATATVSPCDTSRQFAAAYEFGRYRRA